jgi:hypothetical protein
MNTLEANSISTGSSVGEIVGMVVLSKIPASTRRGGTGFHRPCISFDYNNRESLMVAAAMP